MVRRLASDYATFSVSDGVATLRAWTAADAPFIVHASKDPAIQRFSTPHDERGRPDPPPTISDANATIAAFATRWRAAHTTGTLSGVGFAIADASTARVLGQCGIDEWSNDVAQIGYWLAPAARGLGYATRAVVLLSSWLFAADTERIFMMIVADNEPSISVAFRAGFAREETLQDHDIWQGRRGDMLRFGALAGAWTPPITGSGAD